MTENEVAEIKGLIAALDPDNCAALIAMEVGLGKLKCLLDLIGGGQVYLPTFENFIDDLRRMHRDAEICRRYTRGNAHELAAEFGLKPRRVRQIVAAQKPSREVSDA